MGARRPRSRRFRAAPCRRELRHLPLQRRGRKYIDIFQATLRRRRHPVKILPTHLPHPRPRPPRRKPRTRLLQQRLRVQRQRQIVSRPLRRHSPPARLPHTAHTHRPVHRRRPALARRHHSKRVTPAPSKSSLPAIPSKTRAASRPQKFLLTFPQKSKPPHAPFDYPPPSSIQYPHNPTKTTKHKPQNSLTHP